MIIEIGAAVFAGYVAYNEYKTGKLASALKELGNELGKIEAAAEAAAPKVVAAVEAEVKKVL